MRRTSSTARNAWWIEGELVFHVGAASLRLIEQSDG